jgi:hypothetical protein
MQLLVEVSMSGPRWQASPRGTCQTASWL